jgi:multiple sugar transport system permease protein
MSGKKSSDIFAKCLTYFFLIAGLIIVITPFLFMISTALKPHTYVFEIPPKLIPNNITFQNFMDALTKDDFGLYFINSLVVAICATAGTIIISSMMAYAFARIDFPFSKALFYILLLGIMVPSVMVIIPQFIMSKQLNTLDTKFGLICVYITMSMAQQTFLLKGYFSKVPKELEEAAFIDGANRWTIFWKVIMPLSKPGLATVTIFTFLYSWDEFAFAHVSIQTVTKRTLPIAIALFQSQYLTQWGLVFAASLLSLIPVILVFIIFQKHFIKGISTSGLKG